jgi:nitroreductase
MGIQNLALMARAYGVETHWIAGALLVGDAFRDALQIPATHDIAFFGVIGYPSEEIDQPIPDLGAVCDFGSWGGGVGADSEPVL